MKLGYLFIFSALLSTITSCTPHRGCTERTAENFELVAEEDDGTCIPSRDKVIGNYSYSRFWTDVVSGNDFLSFGTVRLTEANVAVNSFNANFDGSLFLQGAITRDVISITSKTIDLSTYTGSGMWVSPDTVDAVFTLTLTDPLLPAAQDFVFYCKKTE
ncbi:MAG: hypothetical protein ACPGD8_03430 [Flavobacteriales bacterium]